VQYLCCHHSDTSQRQQRKKEAKCVEASARIQNLNPGRDCLHNSACKSDLCLNGIC